MPPMVTACTGLFRGTVTNRNPLDMTICLPSRTIRKPALSNARTARRRGTPGILGNSDWHLDFSDFAPLERIPDCSQIFPNGSLDVLQGLLFRGALRPASGQARTTHANALFGPLQHH